MACSRLRTARLAIPVLTILAGACDGTPTSRDATRPTTVLDQVVAIPNGHLDLHCEGEGETTAVLIAGFNDDGRNWGSVTPQLARSTRVCWYSRFGTGDSDPPSEPQTFSSQARDLDALLHAAGEPGPYVVVGHSYGGAQAVTFASLFPKSVTGLVLVDASPPAWERATCDVPDDGTPVAVDFNRSCDAVADPSRNPEHFDGPAAFAGVTAISSLGSVPLVVLTASWHPFPGLAPAEEVRLNAVWDAGQEHWISLSSASELIRVDHTGHYIQLDQSAAVIEQVRRLLP
jgi:pimeloyl-ACP methyl ester carboxylesterase